MADCYIVRRGGGGGVSLKINAIASASDLPTTGSNGDIYIVTQTTLTGLSFFQPTQPTGTFAVGDVWVMTSEKSAAKVNLASKGTILIGLKQACVWNGSQWVNSELHVWYDGQWADGVYYLIVGGALNEPFSATNATVTMGNGYVNATAISGSSGNYRTSVAVDLTDYSTLYCVTRNNGDLEAAIGVWSATSTPSTPNARTKMSNTAATTVTLDVSSLSGNYYVGVWGASQSSSSYKKFNIDIYDMWLE